MLHGGHGQVVACSDTVATGPDFLHRRCVRLVNHDLAVLKTECFELADRNGLLRDPELAVKRMRALLALYGA